MPVVRIGEIVAIGLGVVAVVLRVSAPKPSTGR
jgi:hypothetical protein